MIERFSVVDSERGLKRVGLVQVTFLRNRGLCHRNRGAYEEAVKDFTEVGMLAFPPFRVFIPWVSVAKGPQARCNSAIADYPPKCDLCCDLNLC